MRTSILVLLGALMFSGCKLGVVGSGKVVSEDRPVADFTAVSLERSGKLTIEQTGTESLTITTDDNILPYLASEVWNGELTLGMKSNLSCATTGEITYALQTKTIKELKLEGIGDIDAKSIDVDVLKVLISGIGDVSLSGKANRLDVTISGAGTIHSEQLTCNVVTIRISGSGDATVAASAELNAKISGSGSIKYVGDPKVAQSISGSGVVEKK